MEEKFRKISSVSSDSPPSPILLRRRLSAPETIMRKHLLAQQRSQSQDSDTTHSSDVKSYRLQYNITTGSDSNLNIKREVNLMRKSTLLRRLWNQSKPFTGSKFSGSFCEWQHSCGRISRGSSTRSLGSVHSSPEHMIKSSNRRSLNSIDTITSPHHKPAMGQRKMSPKHQPPSPKRKIPIYNGSFDTSVPLISSILTSNESTTYNSSTYTWRTSSNTSKATSSVTTTNETTSSVNTRNTRSSATTTSYTTVSDYLDSAYANSRSKFSDTMNNNSSNNTSHSDSTKEMIHVSEGSEVNENKAESKAFLKETVVNTDSLAENNSEDYIRYVSALESSTQTPQSTNLNVISNVNLSQSTLDIIFNQVMNDLKNNLQPSVNVIKELPDNLTSKKAEQVVSSREVPSFYLKRKDEIIQTPTLEERKISRYMLSNIGTGDPYGKPNQSPQVVPRYSALPRTSSMEVNTSSNDNTDRESDTVSLVDSLEDNASRLDNNCKGEEISIEGTISPLLPDNSLKKPKNPAKPISFYFSIDDETPEYKSVAEHLPEKVREKLARRKQNMLDKREQNSVRGDSSYGTTSENGNLSINPASVLSSKLNQSPKAVLGLDNKIKKKSRITLPNIENSSENRFFKTENRGNKGNMFKGHNTLPNRYKKSNASKPRSKMTEKLAPIYTTKNKYVCSGSRRIYHKTQFNESDKRIEILEIVECMDTPEKIVLSKGKSKIPILVQPKESKRDSPVKSEKPTFLDFDDIQVHDPKLDQLIANILIDTLNNGEIGNKKEHNTNDRMLLIENEQQIGHLPEKQCQNFEAIPEETNNHNSSEDDSKQKGKEYYLKDNNNFYEACDSESDQKITENDNVKFLSNEDSVNKMDISNQNYINIVEQDDKIKTKSDNNDPDDKLVGSKNALKKSSKSRVAVAVVKDENCSTIPKGWITFYTLNKSQSSSESTSDEGENLGKTRPFIQSTTKERNENVSKQCNANKRERNMTNSYKTQQDLQEITKSSNVTEYNKLSADNDDFNAFGKQGHKSPCSESNESSKKFLYSNKKKCKGCNGKDHKTEKPGEWFVTVSGKSNFYEYPSNLEMRLRFPGNQEYNNNYSDNYYCNNNAPSQSDSGLGDDHSHNRRIHFPIIENKKKSNLSKRLHNSKTYSYKECPQHRLPDVPKGKNEIIVGRRSESSAPLGKTSMSHIEPRQTRTSTRRYNLTRPKVQLPWSDSGLKATHFFDERQYIELLKHLPEILAITGSAMSPEKRPKAFTLSEQDLTRNRYD